MNPDLKITKVEAIPFGVPVASEFTELSFLKENILKHRLKVVDGCIELPQGPGFGAELNEEVFEKVRIQF